MPPAIISISRFCCMLDAANAEFRPRQVSGCQEVKLVKHVTTSSDELQVAKVQSELFEQRSATISGFLPGPLLPYFVDKIDLPLSLN